MPKLPAYWTLDLARADTLDVLGSLDLAKNKRLSLGLNKPGTCDFSIRGTLDVARYIEPWVTCVIARRNGVPIWSGPIQNVNDSSETATVSAIGWFELLNRRLLLTGVMAPAGFPTTDATTMVYNEVDQGAIAADLIQRTNATWPTNINIGSIQSSTARNRTYQRFQNIGGEIDTLTKVDSGFDWTIDPLLRTFNVWFRTVKVGTTIFGLGADRPDVIFGYRWGPNNLRDIGRLRDGSKAMNQSFMVGSYGTAVVPDLRSGPTQSILDLGLFQESQSLPDVPGGDQGQRAFLLSYAAAEVAIREYPQQIYSLYPRPYTGPDCGVPEPFVDYGMGDITYFVARHGRIQVPDPSLGDDRLQPLRVFGLNIGIEDNGLERLDAIQGVMT